MDDLGIPLRLWCPHWVLAGKQAFCYFAGWLAPAATTPAFGCFWCTQDGWQLKAGPSTARSAIVAGWLTCQKVPKWFQDSKSWHARYGRMWSQKLLAWAARICYSSFASSYSIFHDVAHAPNVWIADRPFYVRLLLARVFPDWTDMCIAAAVCGVIGLRDFLRTSQEMDEQAFCDIFNRECFQKASNFLGNGAIDKGHHDLRHEALRNP